MTWSYNSIVSVHGEVLHNEHHDNVIRDGDLLLADVGAETPEGWAGDVTRTWPVSGELSATQRAMYEAVLAAPARGDRGRPARRALPRRPSRRGPHDGPRTGRSRRSCAATRKSCTSAAPAGCSFRTASATCSGSTSTTWRISGDLRRLRARTLPRGVAGRSLPAARSGSRARHGRHHRARLLPDPGNPPGPEGARRARGRPRPRELERFSDVRGIRIEDDVLVTATGAEVLTRAIPKTPSDVEAAVGEPKSRHSEVASGFEPERVAQRSRRSRTRTLEASFRVEDHFAPDGVDR